VESRVLYSRSGRIMAVAAFAFALLGFVALAADSLTLLLTKSWIYLWFGYFAWLLFWNPSVEISSSGVRIDNVFRSFDVDWSAIRRIDTKYSLTLDTEAGIIRAWAAPAPSRYAGLLANRTEADHLPESSFVGNRLVRPGDLTSSDSGVAAFLIRSHWEKLRDRGELEGLAEVSTSWRYPRILIFSVLFLAAVVGFIY
jgi:hypothetical protein